MCLGLHVPLIIQRALPFHEYFPLFFTHFCYTAPTDLSESECHMSIILYPLFYTYIMVVKALVHCVSEDWSYSFCDLSPGEKGLATSIISYTSLTLQVCCPLILQIPPNGQVFSCLLLPP